MTGARLVLPIELDDELKAVLRDILQRTINIEGKLMSIQAVLEELAAKVAEQGTVVESAIVLMDGLTVALRDFSGDPAKITALLDQIEAQRNALAEAIVRNTPAAPAAPVTPAPIA
jgi:uncharacterized coiled-coil protein SlyX